MEILATKIAELLDVTIEQAILLYPVLRGQFITYEILDTLGMVAFLLFTVGVAVTIIAGLEYKDVRQYKDKKDIDYYKREYKEFLSRWGTLKMSFIFTSISIIITITVSSLKIILSPDLMIIMKFLK